MNDTFSFDVFLSHNKADKPRVHRLAERLKEKGLRVWLDDWVVKPGDDIFLSVERGLQAARVLVLCMSPEALGSGWVGLERNTVLFRDPATPAAASSRCCWSIATFQTRCGATSTWTTATKPTLPSRNCSLLAAVQRSRVRKIRRQS